MFLQNVQWIAQKCSMNCTKMFNGLHKNVQWIAQYPYFALP